MKMRVNDGRKPKFGPAESQKAFIRYIDENGGITTEEALEFEDFENYWFGLGIDAMDVLDKLIFFEVVRIDRGSGRFHINMEYQGSSQPV